MRQTAASCEGQRGVLYGGEPHVTAHADPRRSGGGLSAHLLVGAYEIIVEYGGADKRRVCIL